MLLHDLTILIPARAGSKRVPGKNLRSIGGKSLLERAVKLALELVDGREVFVSTDSHEYAELARQFGATVPSLRPRHIAQDSSTDIEWLIDAIQTWEINSEFVSILRPTSPLLKAKTLLRAKEKLERHADFDSIRALKRVTEHPGKMWRLISDEAIPLFPQIKGITPTHSRPTQSLEEIYVQCGAFEVARTQSVVNTETISGNKVLGWVLDYPENIDINSMQDFRLAEFEIANL